MDIKLMTNGLFYIDDDDLDWFYGDYQKGDRVRCVDSCDEPSVTTGKVYTVTKIEDMEFIEILWLIDDTGDTLILHGCSSLQMANVTAVAKLQKLDMRAGAQLGNKKCKIKNPLLHRVWLYVFINVMAGP